MLNPRSETILIIGHDILAFGLAAMLRARGLRVVVRGGERADDAAALTGPRPSAIIVDLMVARRDDFALLRRLRSTPHLAEVPLLVLSPGTVSKDSAGLEKRLRAFDARPLLDPHEFDTVLGELRRAPASVA